MKTNISCVIWYPGVGNELRGEAKELTLLSEEWFKDKFYCPEVEEYDIFWEAPPKDAMFLYVPRRPAYARDKIIQAPPDMRVFPPIRLYKNMTINLCVDFDEYISQTSKIGRWNVIGKAVLSYLREMKYPVVLRKVFDCERFNSDMEAFFRSLGCSLD